MVYCFTIFCQCGWEQDIVPDQSPSHLATAIMTGYCANGCPWCEGKQLKVKNCVNQKEKNHD